MTKHLLTVASGVVVLLFVGFVVAFASRIGDDGHVAERKAATAYCQQELVPALLSKAAEEYSGVNAIDFDDFAPGGVRVTGSVDTHNKFDVPVQMNWGCSVHRKDEKWKVDELWIEPADR